MNIPQKEIKLPIRVVDFCSHKIGGDTSTSFMSENENKTKNFFGLEIPYIIDETIPNIIKNLWEKSDILERIEIANKTECDFISIKFNLSESTFQDKLPKIKKEIKEIFAKAKKPIILRGANNKNVDKVLLPFFAKNAPERCIIAFGDDITYEEISVEAAKHNHILVLRSPIDINLAKELNILSRDKGMKLENLLIDPDMGSLGYGLDYGFSIVEKIRECAFDGDDLLNLPIIVFAGEEAFRAKEAKSDKYSESWGEYDQRAVMWEISTAAPMISAGANIVVLWHPKSISTLKGVLE